VLSKVEVTVVRVSSCDKGSVVQALLLLFRFFNYTYRNHGFKYTKDDVESSNDDEGQCASRLAQQSLTSKQFMQRSAHKATASSPTTPNGPPSKKARLSNGHSAPGTPGTADHEILQSALAAEEKKRQEALDKAAQHAGETKWVLSYTDPLAGKRQESLQVTQAGFAELDEDDSDDEEVEARPIRKKFGGGLKKKEVRIELRLGEVRLLT
jgi:hypothetical protein